jgi:tetratricopeptide (TPR) repeat protein
MPYRDFDLKLAKRNGGCTVEVLASPLVRSEPLPLQAPSDQVADWVESVKTGQADRQTCKNLGRELFRALFPQEIQNIWSGCQGFMLANSSLRLRLDIRAPELAAVPWELIHDGQCHLAMAPERPIVRYLYDRPVIPPEENPQPLNILVVVSAPRGVAALPAAEHEFEFIAQGLQEMIAAGKVGRLDLLEGATLGTLQNKLRQGYHILHYVGHGVFMKDTGYLVLEGTSGVARRVDAETLGLFFRGTSLRLLVLNACQTATPSQVNPLLGVAQAALAAGVPAVVAMQGAIRDDVAAAFAREFYETLAEGWPLEICMVEGRKAIMELVYLDRPDWAIPVLFSNAAEGFLWQPGEPAVSIAPFVRVPVQPRASAVTRGAGVAPSAAAVVAPQPEVLDNLPAQGYVRFIGREPELQQIMTALEPQSGVGVVTITGISGMGRSALAREVAGRYLDFSRQNPTDRRAFQGIIWASAQRTVLDAQGIIRPSTSALWSLDDLYMTIASAFKKREFVQARTEDRLHVMQDLLRENRYLLILADADEVSDPRLRDFLRNLPPPTRAILTSCLPLDIPCLTISLSGLDEEEARQLLRLDAEAGQVEEILQADPDELGELLRQAGGLPLALRWAVSQVRDSGLPVAKVVQRLSRAGDQPLAEYCLRRSVRDLTVPQYRLFLGIALYPQPTHVEAAGEAAGVRGEELSRALARLLQLRLVQPAEHGCYQLIPLARQYGLQMLEEDHSFRQSATVQAVPHMLQFAREHNRWGESWAGFDLLEAEVGNLMWAVRQAYELQLPEVLDFRDALGDFLYMRGYWNESIQMGLWVFEAADRVAHPDRGWQKAWCTLYPLARVHFQQGNYEEAQRWCERGLAMFRQMEHERGVVGAERYLGRVFQARGELDRAQEIFASGLARARASLAADLALQGHLLAALASVAYQRGTYDQARSGYEEALALYRRIGDNDGMVTTLQRLGEIALSQRRYAEAERLVNEVLQRLEGTGWVGREATALYTQGLLAEERGKMARAQNLLLQARARFYSLAAAPDLAKVNAALVRVSAAITYRQRRGGTA